MIFPNNAAILGIFVGILNGIPLPPSLRDPLEIGTLHVRFYRYIFYSIPPKCWYKRLLVGGLICTFQFRPSKV